MLMPEMDVPGAFIDREEVFDTIAQARRDIGCIVRKGS